MTRKQLEQRARGGRPSTSVAAGGLARVVPVWKTIEIGSYDSVAALRHALKTAGCRVGRRAGEALGQAALAFPETRAQLDLAVVSPAELRVGPERASLPAVYARARRLGLGLCPAEVAPQLRLQYRNQPVGEFLRTAMSPIPLADGKGVVLLVGNGGAGLLLIAADGHLHSPLPPAVRLVFTRLPLSAASRHPILPWRKP